MLQPCCNIASVLSRKSAKAPFRLVNTGLRGGVYEAWNGGNGGLLALAVASQNAQAKTLEEVLKEKGVITEADYQEIVKSAPKTKPVDYKLGKGFTFTSPDEKFQLSVGGNLQLLYQYNQNDGPGVGNSSEWRIRRAKTGFSGYAFSKDLTYKVLLNWAELQNSGSNSKVLEEGIPELPHHR